ncbi:hypothetical protein BC835DRAFT_1413608 [Cytidiella melzeri]|nr:hypothetical protein BC835DRAFT_1413608 [Cytidiella melzeri]
MANHTSANSHEATTVARREEYSRISEPEAARNTFQEITAEQSYFPTLPLEIILAIFRLVVLGDHAFVVILAQVCRGWHQVVVSTPILWSTLSLSRQTRKPEEKAMLWQSRNQGLLRRLRIRCSDRDVHATFNNLADVALESLRFLSVDGMSRQNLCSVLPQLTPSVISNLYSLELRHSDFLWFRDTSELKLHSLVTEYTLVDWATLGDHSTELRNLTYKNVLDMDAVPDILWLLHRNPHLESILFRCFRYPSGIVLPYPTPRFLPSCIELRNLTKLSLSGGAIPAQLLHSLSLPNLRSVELQNLYRNLGPILRALVDNGAVARVVSVVIVHDWNHYSADIDLFIEFLRKAISLDYMELLGIANVKGVLEAITQHSHELCPQWTTLSLTRCRDVTDDLLIALVEARKDTRPTATCSDVADSPRPVKRLHTLIINSCDKVTDDGLTRLRERMTHVTRY